MDLSWLMPVRKALASLARLRAVAPILYRRALYFVLIEEERRAARLRNEAASVQVLAAHVKLAEDVVKLMRNTGFTSSEIRTAMRATVVHRLRRQAAVYSCAEVQMVSAKNKVAHSLKDRRGAKLTSVNENLNRRSSDAAQP